MKTKGKWFWKSTWYSICSIHGMGDNENCSMCNTGSWSNNISQKISSYIHDNHYPIWYWWMNKGPDTSFKELTEEARQYDKDQELEKEGRNNI